MNKEPRRIFGTSLEEAKVFGGVALTAGGLVAAGYEVAAHTQPRGENHTTPTERQGDHHGSTGMPSDEHLTQFTRKHGVKIHGKYGIGTAVKATWVDDHFEASKP